MTISLRKSQSWVEFAYHPASDDISASSFAVTRRGDLAIFSFDASSNLRERSESNNKADFRDFESHRKAELLSVIIDEEKVSQMLIRWFKQWGIPVDAPAKLEVKGSINHIFDLPRGFDFGEDGELRLTIRES